MKAGLERLVLANAIAYLEFGADEIIISFNDNDTVSINLDDIIDDCIKDYKLYTIRLIASVYEYIADFSSTTLSEKYLFILQCVGGEFTIHKIDELKI